MILLMAFSIILRSVAGKRPIQPADIAPPLLSYRTLSWRVKFDCRQFICHFLIATLDIRAAAAATHGVTQGLSRGLPGL